MTTLPPFNPVATMQVLGADDYWFEDDGRGDLFVGYPYKWGVTLLVQAQAHSSHLTPTPLFYDGNDVKVGQWVTGQLNGMAWRISSIISQTYSSVTCIIEDVERFNIFVDPQQLGGNPESGSVVLFELAPDGQPVLTGLPSGILPDGVYQSLDSRFSFRNTVNDYVRVDQPSHGFELGDMIYMQNDGTYATLAASPENKLLLATMVGQVSDITGTDHFAWKPRGEIRTDVVFPVDSAPGQLIYLDPTVPGKLTATKPSKLATPVYIRLETLTKGIYMGAGSGGGAVDEDELRFATVYRVDNIAARDALDLTKLKQGDQAYVSDTGNGEWALFLVSSKTLDPLAVSWTKLVDFDSSTVDGRTVGVEFTFTQTVPVDLYRISPLDRVTVVTVEVLEAFHISADLSIGDDADNERLAERQHIDLSTLGTYTINPSYQYGGTEESMIRAYPNPGTSTSGRVKVTISYI